MAASIVIVLAVLALAAGGAWLVRFLQRALDGFSARSTTELGALQAATAEQLAQRSAEVDRRIGQLTEAVDRRLGELDQKVDRRLETAQKTSTEIHERLGKVDSAAAQMLDRAKDLSRLEQALRPPKARGGFGELLLENLLRDRLPSSAYAIQHTFSSGDRVDAVVRAGQLISVDSKFPLDNYQRLVEAEQDAERQLHEKAFARDVRNHVDAIAAKYIRPEEGTYDFAFMYVPVEAVYYELACGASSAVLQYAHGKRVFPVSPSTFTAYLQVIVLGLRGLQIEQRAGEVMAYVAELNRDFSKFTEHFDLVGTHLGRAQAKYADADKQLGRFAGKLEQASEEVAETVELDTATHLVEEIQPHVIEAA